MEKPMICIDPGNSTNCITKDKIYIITKQDKDCYIIKQDDRKKPRLIYKKRFKPIDTKLAKVLYE
jgi:hypothetical protein